MPKLNIRNLLLFLVFTSIAPLIAVYIAEFGFGLAPCELCLWQRKPFFIIIFLTIFALFFASKPKLQKTIIILCVMAIFTNFVIAIYHFGVEKKIFTGLAGCSGGNLNEITDLEELKLALKETAVVKCDEPAFEFLKVSMAGWNAIYNFLLLLTLFFIRIRKI